MFWSHHNFNWKYSKVLGKISVMLTAVGSGEEQPFPIQCIVKNSLGDFCDYPWRHPHQVQVYAPSGETDTQPEGRCRKGLWCHQSLTVVCLISCPSWGCSCRRESQHSVPMIMPSSIMYDYPPRFLRWWQRAVAWFQIYWYDLLWSSERVNK